MGVLPICNQLGANGLNLRKELRVIMHFGLVSFMKIPMFDIEL